VQGVRRDAPRAGFGAHTETDRQLGWRQAEDAAENLVVLWQRAESNRGYLADVTSSAAATIMACPAAHRYRQRIYIDSIIETVRRRLLRAERSVGNYVTH
jgi:hypothetical protein